MVHRELQRQAARRMPQRAPRGRKFGDQLLARALLDDVTVSVPDGVLFPAAMGGKVARILLISYSPTLHRGLRASIQGSVGPIITPTISLLHRRWHGILLFNRGGQVRLILCELFSEGFD